MSFANRVSPQSKKTVKTKKMIETQKLKKENLKRQKNKLYDAEDDLIGDVQRSHTRKPLSQVSKYEEQKQARLKEIEKREEEEEQRLELARYQQR